ncbi:MAG: phosphatase [Microscillaceae bacterium]|nr:phosphatase [Microscillaceae bacterium]
MSDWDGVFNNGAKNPEMPSPFYEADSMGTNLLRFMLWQRTGQLPPFAIITGALNPTAQYLAEREHFSDYYGRVLNKAEALVHFCTQNTLSPEEVAVFFDDANDLGMAQQAGLRFLITRPGINAFARFVYQKGWADYLTGQTGGQFAVREICEQLMELQGQTEAVLMHRADFSEAYRQYFAARQALNPRLWQWDGQQWH